MRILHLIRNRNDDYALEIAWSQSQNPNTEVIILLLQDGVLTSLDTKLKTYVCQADIVARGVSTPYEIIDYPQIVDLIFACDRVISW
jgi:sulfur relay protein TusB/DsrH